MKPISAKFARYARAAILLGAVAAGPRRARAGEFVEFVLSAQGRAILARHGFGPPEARAREGR